MSEEDKSRSLQRSLDELAQWEKEMSEIDKDIEIYRIKKTQAIYSKRRDILNSIPKFWYIVLAENDDFADYIYVDDLKYLEFIDDIYIDYPIISPSTYKDFTITIKFSEKNDLIAGQTITKSFKTIIEDGEERLISEPVEFEWPTDSNLINPQVIKQKNKGNKNWSTQDKKSYRLSMKSFFAWFGWTGKKPGKEFKNGEDLTRLIVDDLYLNALKYYILALPNGDDDEDDEEDEDDSSEGEELDLSGDEHDSEEEENDNESKTNKRALTTEDDLESKKHKH
ncbi:uncharacterized protein RJT21DRAFT_117590 [Scheffersomyces amazonensis]|uniref:uncharacterized protein n=1 Tax=Scheffersomyces amazonensis TaxID=1078765 RepID=UPI00315D6C1D